MWLLLFDWFWRRNSLPFDEPLPDSGFALLCRFVSIEVVDRPNVTKEVFDVFVGIADFSVLTLGFLPSQVAILGATKCWVVGCWGYICVWVSSSCLLLKEEELLTFAIYR